MREATAVRHGWPAMALLMYDVVGTTTTVIRRYVLPVSQQDLAEPVLFAAEQFRFLVSCLACLQLWCT